MLVSKFSSGGGRKYRYFYGSFANLSIQTVVLIFRQHNDTDISMSCPLSKKVSSKLVSADTNILRRAKATVFWAWRSELLTGLPPSLHQETLRERSAQPHRSVSHQIRFSR